MVVEFMCEDGITRQLCEDLHARRQGHPTLKRLQCIICKVYVKRTYNDGSDDAEGYEPEKVIQWRVRTVTSTDLCTKYRGSYC